MCATMQVISKHVGGQPDPRSQQDGRSPNKAIRSDSQRELRSDTAFEESSTVLRSPNSLRPTPRACCNQAPAAAPASLHLRSSSRSPLLVRARGQCAPVVTTGASDAAGEGEAAALNEERC